MDYICQPNLKLQTMKNILWGILILIITLSCMIENSRMSLENGKLSGIATHTDSYESTNQPDAGCELYAVNDADVKSSMYADITGVIETFRRNKSMYAFSMSDIIDPGKIKKVQDNFDTVSKFTSNYISGFKQLPSVVKTTTNSKGGYTLSLRPGKYFILVVSGSVKSNNIAESKGNIGFKVVDIKSVGESFLNVNFVKHEPFWFMSMFNLSGC
jgi:hypothetical protein